MEISRPMGFKNDIHVEVDLSTPYGIVYLILFFLGLRGLPEDWRLALEANNISKDDVIQNGPAVINVLQYQFSSQDVAPKQPPVRPPNLTDSMNTLCSFL